MESSITIKTIVKSTPQQVWDCWTDPVHITKWNQASPDWHCPMAYNELYQGGKFSFRMASKNGENSFDFEGVYQRIIPQKQIDYIISDGRRVSVLFSPNDQGVIVTEQFEPETENPRDLQKAGWQTILENFKNYAEASIASTIV